MYENMKDKNIPKKCSFKISIFPTPYNCIDWYTVAIKMAGIDNKNAILMESSLLKFASSAAVITIPALDTPGIIASVCMNPIKTIVNILMNFNLLIYALICLLVILGILFLNKKTIK